MKYFLSLIFLFSVSSSLAQEVRLSVPYTKHVLSNGLTLILHEDHTTPTMSVNIWYHVGSGSEKPGRTGFAHLFEHIMFEGSANVPEGKFDEWLEAAGGLNNGSTSEDYTNYFEDIPNNALELALFVESDRLGYLLEAMSPGKVDGQRDVVKNERRQSYENRPYGMAFLEIGKNLYPPDHPYHWPTIGSMEDLTAASYEDVVDFFKSYYIPNNASLVIAGAIDPVKTKELVEKWFNEIPPGKKPDPVFAPPPRLAEEKRLLLEDRVQLPRLYMVWPTPATFAPGDADLDIVAAVLAGGKNSRLYKRLVYDLQIAQDVSAGQSSSRLSSMFILTATARSGYELSQIKDIVDEEIRKLQTSPPEKREVERAVNRYEAGFLSRLEGIGGFSGKASQLNSYFFYTGNPDYFNEDLARYKAIDPQDIQTAAQQYLKPERILMSVVPRGKKELAVPLTAN